MNWGRIEQPTERSNGGVYIVSDKQAIIDGRNIDAHYTDSRFYSGAKTIFLQSGYKLVPSYGGDTVKGLEYNYSDRLWQLDYKRAQIANKTAFKIVGNRNIACYFEIFLNVYFRKRSIDLVHILAGVNKGNGYSYLVYGYLPNGKEVKK